MNEANENPSQLSPLSLAHLGDAVYELYVRNRVIHEHPTMPAHKLHLQTVKYVKAHAQSNSINAIMELLSDDELAVFRRGRNAKSYTVPKNANLGDYHRATGFEALMGYLYLTGDRDRLDFIMDKAFINAVSEV